MIASERVRCYWFRWGYEHGVYNEYDRRDAAGRRLPDPHAIVRRALRLLERPPARAPQDTSAG